MTKTKPTATKLTTLAITSSRRNPHGTATATLVSGVGGRPVLRIDGTPGQWFLADLIGAKRVSIDFGQEWILENPAELLAEAGRIVRGSDDLEVA